MGLVVQVASAAGTAYSVMRAARALVAVGSTAEGRTNPAWQALAQARDAVAAELRAMDQRALRGDEFAGAAVMQHGVPLVHYELQVAVGGNEAAVVYRGPLCGFEARDLPPNEAVRCVCSDAAASVIAPSRADLPHALQCTCPGTRLADERRVAVERCRHHPHAVRACHGP